MGVEEIKECPQCKTKCEERRPRCKKCGYRFVMLCEGCGRDVKGFSFCKECRQPGYKRAASAKDAIPFPGDEWIEYENMDEYIEGHNKLKTHGHHRHYDWDCYDQYKRLQKLNKKLKKESKK